ncbi:unnamed protein product [Orchesella dallaii]|uniref:Methyltransferase FkbM domain-containing protein n=1 Tax=Orchesella dallaii TaxID=48710 RepID=A0ABP1QEF0_9HEXA
MRTYLSTSRNNYSLFMVMVICVLAMVFLYGTVFRSNIVIDEIECSTKEGIVEVPIEKIMRGEPLVLPQDDDTIVQYIWSKKLVHPPSAKPYNLSDSLEDPSRGQGQLIRKILKNMTNGYFVECGALDGETRSNTLFMEQHLGWKGLLIEGDPSNYEMLVAKNRKSWASNTCLAIKPHPHQARFFKHFNRGRILGESPENFISSGNLSPGEKAEPVAIVQCMPLFSLLKALSVKVVDYFSLDVEGNELQVLKTIPFDKILIRTLSVEYIHTDEGKDKLLDFMLSKGYNLYGEVHYENNLANDLIFVHPSITVTPE